MAKGIKKQLGIALQNVNQTISESASHGFYAEGLSSEGFAGGYRQALFDVIAALNGVPSYRSDYWPRPPNQHVQRSECTCDEPDNDAALKTGN